MSPSDDTLERPAPTRTVQLTSKRLKAEYAIAVLITIIGVLITLASLSASPPGESTGGASLAGLAMSVAGGLWMIGTRIRIWWHHG